MTKFRCQFGSGLNRRTFIAALGGVAGGDAGSAIDKNCANWRAVARGQ